MRLHRRVAILAHETRRRLVGPRPAVGAHLDLNGVAFEVIGVLGPGGTQFSRDGTAIDEQIWIPITAAKALTGSEVVRAIVTRPRERRFDDDPKREVRRILSDRLHVSPHDEEAVFVVSLIDYLSGFDVVFGALDGFLAVLAVTSPRCRGC